MYNHGIILKSITLAEIVIHYEDGNFKGGSKNWRGSLRKIRFKH